MSTLAELQAAREELAREQNIARIRELKLLILANERALPHLSGLPLRHAAKRIVDGRAELATCEMIERLERERDEDVAAGRWSETPLDLATLSDGAAT